MCVASVRRCFRAPRYSELHANKNEKHDNMGNHVFPLLHLCECGEQLNSSLEDLAVCECDPSAGIFAQADLAMLYLLFCNGTAYRILFLYTLHCSLEKRDSNDKGVGDCSAVLRGSEMTEEMWTVVEIEVGTGPSDHMYSYHGAPRVFVCPHQGALVIFVHVDAWRTTAGTYPETQILHSWTLRLMQAVSGHVWQQLSPISSGKSCNKQLVYNDAFNIRAGTQYQHIWMSRCRNFLRKSSTEGRHCWLKRTTFVCFYVRGQLIIFCRWWNPVSINRQVDQILCSSIFSCVFSDRQITILFGGSHFRVLFG